MATFASAPPLPLRAFAVLGGALLLLVGAGFFKAEHQEWRAYQARFRDMEAARAATTAQRAAVRRAPVALRQVVVPELGRVDRCTSCHLAVDDPTYARAQQPFAHHPDHELHPFERFGCTVCHGGQGRAVTAREAHGQVAFWGEPLLPLEYVEASCGKCHDPQDNPAAPRLARGTELFEGKGCRGCHRVAGWGGQVGPELDRPAADHRRSPDWLKRHFLDPGAVSPGSAMPKYGFTEDEARALTFYALTLREPPVSGYFASRRLLESAHLGARLFEAKGCIGCHAAAGKGGNVGPRLDDVAGRRTERWLVAHFRDPQAVSPGTVMPQFGFTEAEARSLVLFLKKLAGGGAAVRAPSLLTPEQRGEILYKRHGCRGCHGEDGRGGVPNPNAVSGEQVPPLRYVKEGYTVAELRDRLRNGVPSVARRDTRGPEPPLRMPGWGDRLTEGQLDDLMAYLLSLYPKEEETGW